MIITESRDYEQLKQHKMFHSTASQKNVTLLKYLHTKLQKKCTRGQTPAPAKTVYPDVLLLIRSNTSREYTG